MSISKTMIAGISFLTVATSTVALMAAYQGPEKSELTHAFCPKIYNEQSYKGGDLDHYAMLIPGKGGWIFRTKNDFRSDWRNSTQTVNYLQGLQEAFRKQNADLVIVMPPVRGLMHADRLLDEYKQKFNLENPATIWKEYETSMDALREKGLHIVSLESQDASPNFFYQRNHHWSPEGARVAARKVAQYVKKLPAYRDMPKIQYATQAKGNESYDSSFQKAFKTICGSTIAPEQVTVYETTPVHADNNEAAIFGQGAKPRIILLGTSNSTEAASANFEGFLKEALSADILNLSNMGAGIDTSIMSYINSAQFRTPERKIVIWEVPGYYYFDEMDDKLFSQLIPAAYGSCGQGALMRKKLALGGPETTLLDVKMDKTAALADIEAAGRDLYMHLNFPQPVEDKIALKFSYDNGNTKRVQFQRSDRYPHDGDFYTLFPFKAGVTSLNRIKLVAPAGMSGSQVTAEICKLPQSTKVVSQ